MKHRGDIDGLRALSVLLVVFYHADLLECHSGYIGVDVFFVISGYLVSQLIVRDLDRGQFSLQTFFARRIRRLLPCLLAVCLTTTALGWFFMLPEEFKHLGAVLISQPLLAANFVYALTTKFGYFGATTVNYPLLHLWSLGVEEQFYVLFPLWLMFFRPHRSLVALFLVSYALSAWSSPLWPAHAYYLLPTRAFELLAGVLAARVNRSLPGWLSWLALVVILAAAWGIPSGTPYPGWVALGPTLAAACLLSQQGTSLHRLLAQRPLAFLGLISYSMYLWHWPLIALLRSSLLWKAHYGTYWLILLIPISYASWRYIEQPLRRRPISNAQSFAFAGAGGFSLAALGLIIWLNQGFPQRLPERAARLAGQEYTPNPYNLEITTEMIKQGQLHHFGSPGKTRLMVIGDSHAMAVLPGLDEACKARGISGLAITHSSTPPLNCDMTGSVGLRERELKDYCTEMQRKIQQEKPDKILLVAAWESYQHQPGFAQGLAETVRTGRCYVMGQVPNVAHKVPRALAYRAWRGPREAWEISVPLAQTRENNQQLKSVLSGAGYLDPLPFFTGEHDLVAVERDGLSLYRDEGHLSVDASRPFANLLLDGLQE